MRLGGAEDRALLRGEVFTDDPAMAHSAARRGEDLAAGWRQGDLILRYGVLGAVGLGSLAVLATLSLGPIVAAGAGTFAFLMHLAAYGLRRRQLHRVEATAAANREVARRHRPV